MLQKKKIEIVYIVAFLIIIFVPLIFANKKENQISKTENRYLSNLPTAKIWDEEYKEQLESWLDDNIAFREKFVSLRSVILYKGLGVVASKNVERGKDGWLFYTLDDNIKIASGEYVLSEGELKDIAEVQQAIHEYYKSIGKSYVLLLVPSKVSVYPEYLYGDYSILSAPCDIVSEYLSEHTDVVVINAKEALISAKEEGMLYWKTDTHPTTLGTYYIYQAIIDKMRDCDLGEFEPVEIEKTNQVMYTDLLDMLGVGETEKADAINVEFSSSLVLHGTYNGYANNISGQQENLYVYENSNCKNEQEVLIYGSSHLWPIRKIPQLLGEHFSRVTFFYQSKVGALEEVDKATTADIVICAIGERAMKGTLSDLPDHISAVIPDVEQRNIGTEVCIDFCNEIEIKNNMTTLAEVVTMIEDRCVLSGWAADLEKEVTVGDMYLKVGEHIFKADYGYSREDVSTAYGSSGLENVGFLFDLPKQYLYDDTKELITSFEIILISKDGTYMYEPKRYELGGTE